MSIKIVDEDLGFDDFFDTIDKLGTMEVEVGYDQASGSEGDIELVDLALIHEMGTDTLPSRPFIRNSFDLNKGDIGVQGEKLLNQYLDGKIDLELALETWGSFYNDLMRNGVISRALFLEENAQSTIDRKGSDTPLIDTKSMINRSQVMVNKK